MPWLTTEGASHQIGEGETVVGSGAQASWKLASHDLAPKHFVIARRAGVVTVRSCGVDSVIAVNGEQIGSAPVELHDGATIDAGTARFLYSSEKSGSYAAAAVPAAHLVETRGGIAHPLEQQSVGLGRDRLNTVVIRDPTASRFHAEIRREAGGYVLHPHGSSGTLINGRRLGTPCRLQDGDRIEIANVELRFVAGPVPAGSPAPVHVEDDGSSHRRTVIQSAATEIPSEAKARSTWMIWVAAGLVIAITLWLATR